MKKILLVFIALSLSPVFGSDYCEVTKYPLGYPYPSPREFYEVDKLQEKIDVFESFFIKKQKRKAFEYLQSYSFGKDTSFDSFTPYIPCQHYFMLRALHNGWYDFKQYIAYAQKSYYNSPPGDPIELAMSRVDSIESFHLYNLQYDRGNLLDKLKKCAEKTSFNSGSADCRATIKFYNEVKDLGDTSPGPEFFSSSYNNSADSWAPVGEDLYLAQVANNGFGKSVRIRKLKNSKSLDDSFGNDGEIKINFNHIPSNTDLLTFEVNGFFYLIVNFIKYTGNSPEERKDLVYKISLNGQSVTEYSLPGETADIFEKQVISEVLFDGDRNQFIAVNLSCNHYQDGCVNYMVLDEQLNLMKSKFNSERVLSSDILLGYKVLDGYQRTIFQGAVYDYFNGEKFAELFSSREVLRIENDILYYIHVRKQEYRKVNIRTGEDELIYSNLPGDFKSVFSHRDWRGYTVNKVYSLDDKLLLFHEGKLYKFSNDLKLLGIESRSLPDYYAWKVRPTGNLLLVEANYGFGHYGDHYRMNDKGHILSPVKLLIYR